MNMLEWHFVLQEQSPWIEIRRKTSFAILTWPVWLMWGNQPFDYLHKVIESMIELNCMILEIFYFYKFEQTNNFHFKKKKKGAQQQKVHPTLQIFWSSLDAIIQANLADSVNCRTDHCFFLLSLQWWKFNCKLWN